MMMMMMMITIRMIATMMITTIMLMLLLLLKMTMTVTTTLLYVTGEQRALFSLFSVLSESLMYTNHAVNFILYCLSGSRFRQQAAAILCRCCRGAQRSVKTEYSWA
jgi:hypothetical protein